MNTSEILDVLNRHEPQSLHHEADVVWSHAEDDYVTDTNGKKYIDFTSGIFVTNIGHSRVKQKFSIYQQISSNLLHSYAFPNEPRAQLVKKLVELTGMEKVYLCSTGSEAIDAVFRCMWAYKYGGFLAVKGCNHGRTTGSRILAEEATLDYKTKPNRGIKPEYISGIIFETYLGYNAQFHPVKWVQQWCGWAKNYDIPVCFDEVQAGFGRTGKMFGYEHYGVKPDLIVLGKALSGCLPISAVCGRADLLDAPDDLSSTHTGNPVCCAAALSNIEIIESDHLVERASQLGEKLGQKLTELPYKINGKGMIWAIDLNDVDLANMVVDECANRGLLMVKTHRGTLKIGPPLTIAEDTLWQGLGILQDALQSISRGFR